MRVKSREIQISSASEETYRIERFVEEICDQYYINNSYFGNILIAIEEAVNNAIVHGNGNDRNKTVRIKFTPTPAGLEFTIRDEGDGFDFNSIPDPLTGEETNYNGRGLFLIRALSDETSFNKKGNKISILFKISSINTDTSIQRINELSKYFASKKTTAGKSE